VDDERGMVEYGETGRVVSDALHLEPVRLPVRQRRQRVDDALASLRGADTERRVGCRVSVVGDEAEGARRHDAIVLVVDN